MKPQSCYSTPYTKEMNYYCQYNMMYIVYIFSVKKKILFTVLLKLKPLSLETKWVINITTFVFSCLQVIDISNMLKKIENTGICIIHGSIPEVCRSSIKTKNPHNLQNFRWCNRVHICMSACREEQSYYRACEFF